MKSSFFALCVLCSIAAAFCGRQLKDIDLDDTCCSPITFDDRTGSLLVARDEDRDNCDLDDDADDEMKRLYGYFLYSDGTCFIRSSEPCSRFVREDNSDDDYSQNCTEAQVTEYNANFQTAVERLSTQGPSSSLSAVAYPPSPSDNGSNDDNSDDDNNNNSNDDDNDDDDNDNEGNDNEGNDNEGNDNEGNDNEGNDNEDEDDK